MDPKPLVVDAREIFDRHQVMLPCLSFQSRTAFKYMTLISLLSAVNISKVVQPCRGASASEMAWTVPDFEVEPDGEELNWVHSELEACKERASAGDAASARRVAELYELLKDPENAVYWWRQAASMKDPDALLYVEMELDEPLS